MHQFELTDPVKLAQSSFERNFPKNATFKLLAMANDELKKFIHF